MTLLTAVDSIPSPSIFPYSRSFSSSSSPLENRLIASLVLAPASPGRVQIANSRVTWDPRAFADFWCPFSLSGVSDVKEIRGV